MPIMGTSSSKASSKRFGNGTRELLSASMSVGLSHNNGTTALTPGQTERASFMNHPIYLPPPQQQQPQRRNQGDRLSPDHAASLRAYDLEPYSPIPFNKSARHDNNYNQQYEHYGAVASRNRRCPLHEHEGRFTQSVALGTKRAGHQRLASAAGARLLKGAVAAGAQSRTRRRTSRLQGAGSTERAIGGRNRMLAVPPPPERLQSPSLTHSESLGSQIDFCCCAECCSAAAASEGDAVSSQNCFCDARAPLAEARAEHLQLYADGGVNNIQGAFASSATPKAAAAAAATVEPLDEQHLYWQHFPLARQAAKQRKQRLQQQQQQQQPSQLSSASEKLASNGDREYHVPITWRLQQHHHQALQRRTNKKADSLRAGREHIETQEGAKLELSAAKRQQETLNDNETTTCSLGSSSLDLQPSNSSSNHSRQGPLHPLEVVKTGNSYCSNNSQQALQLAAAATTTTTTTFTTKRKQLIAATNMASAALNHSQHSSSNKDSCKQSNNGTTCSTTTSNNFMSNLSSHKRPSLERGLAMDEEARKRHGLLGLLPAAIQDQQIQSRAVMNFINNCQDELSKYVYLRNLKDFNERLFYYTLTNNVERLMPLVYTPTVGLACQKFSEIYMRPRGLFITANDAGRVRQVVANWPEKDVRVIVVTDGERILGLGDLGANGMGISIGKLSLYTALAGIPPQNVLPITIDVGTENESNLKDPFYIGLRQHRVRGDKYEALVEEFMQAIVERWGRSCLIQFEDFGNSTAFNLLKKYHEHYCTFNDDIQGTASVCLSGLISAAKRTGKRLSDCSFLFYGAGEANLGTAQLLMMAMVEDGLKKEEAKEHIWLVDSKGLVVSSRQDLSGHKREFAREAEPLADLEAIIDFTKPTAIVGASAQGGSFNESICKKMAKHNERPIIFALSNPTSKAECTAAQAYAWTEGKCVFASGSPFDPVDYKGKTYVTGQGNNAYIFPGVGLAAIGAHTHTIPNEAFLVAARALSDQLTSSDTDVGLVYPSLTKIREVTLKVAARVLQYLYTERLATYRPEPSDKLEFLRGIQYDPSY